MFDYYQISTFSIMLIKYHGYHVKRRPIKSALILVFTWFTCSVDCFHYLATVHKTIKNVPRFLSVYFSMLAAVYTGQ